MSLFTGLTAPYKLGGIIGLSSWLLLNQKFASFVPEGSPNKATKIFMGHGSADPLVRYPLGKASEDTLKGLGFDVSFHTYPWLTFSSGMQHSACLEEFKDVENFIHARLN
ncbi:hypothetical protein Golomagni_07399 [Golovinomyces magnicellulatus]|nr:hypothetical protein Golomagni_07399 [Golovinomyces magnicellulatus]